MFRKFNVENIEMLPTLVIDYRIDFRYFLIAAGVGALEYKAIIQDACFIDDLTPPTRKFFNID